MSARFRFPLTLAAFAAVLTASAGQSQTAIKADARSRLIIMFGASWCSPCIGELRAINKLAAAASQERILIAWTDNGIRRYNLALPDHVTIAPLAIAQQLASRYAADVSGLPYSMMLDPQGRKCAERKLPLSPDGIVEMRTLCSQIR